MFCIKCGKNLDPPGICRFCGEENNFVSEHNYFRSPEIELLFNDDEDFLLVKENASPQKKVRQESDQTKEQLNQQQDFQPVLDIARSSDTSATENKNPEAALAEKSSERSDPQQKEQGDLTAAAVPGMRSISDDRKSSGKRRIVAVCAVLVVAAAVSATGIILTKNKKDRNDVNGSSLSSSDSRHDDKEPTTVPGETTLTGDVPAGTETTSEGGNSENTSTAPETTTDPETVTEPELEKGPIRVAVISAGSDNVNIVNGMRNSLFTQDNGFECSELNITDGEIDLQQYDMIVLPMPAVDLEEEQIGRLKKFLENDNKNLLYIPAMSDAETKNINEFIKEWDIEVGNAGFIYNESDGCYINDEDSAYNYGYNIKLSVDDKKMTGGSDYESTGIIAPMTKEIKADNNNKGITKVLEAPVQSKIAEISGKDAEGKDDGRCAAVIAASDKGNNHVIVFGSSEMFSEKYLSNAEYANKDVILRILKTAAGRENSSGDSDN